MTLVRAIAVAAAAAARVSHGFLISGPRQHWPQINRVSVSQLPTRIWLRHKGHQPWRGIEDLKFSMSVKSEAVMDCDVKFYEELTSLEDLEPIFETSLSSPLNS